MSNLLGFRKMIKNKLFYFSIFLMGSIQMIASSKQLPYQKNDQNPISSLVAQIVPTLANRSRNEGVLGRALTGSSKKGREKNPSSVQPKNTVEEHIIEQEDERTQSSASKQLLKQNRELETELKKYKEREEKSLELATRLAAATTEKAKIEEQLSQ